jgi:hypothetical protein
MDRPFTWSIFTPPVAIRGTTSQSQADVWQTPAHITLGREVWYRLQSGRLCSNLSPSRGKGMAATYNGPGAAPR